jgi:hypothetical protein
MLNLLLGSVLAVDIRNLKFNSYFVVARVILWTVVCMFLDPIRDIGVGTGDKVGT